MPIHRVLVPQGYQFLSAQEAAKGDLVEHYFEQRALKRNIRTLARKGEAFLSRIHFQDDFDRAALDSNIWVTTAAASSIVGLVAIAGGAVELSALDNIGITGEGTLSFGAAITILPVNLNPRVALRARMREATQLTAQFGLTAAANFTSANAVYFENDPVASAVNWFGIVRDNANTRTTVDLGVAGVADEWRLFLFDISDDMTRVDFYISAANSLVPVWRGRQEVLPASATGLLPNNRMAAKQTSVTARLTIDVWDYWMDRASS